jgi:hypothetical protein
MVKLDSYVVPPLWVVFSPVGCASFVVVNQEFVKIGISEIPLSQSVVVISGNAQALAEAMDEILRADTDGADYWMVMWVFLGQCRCRKFSEYIVIFDIVVNSWSVVHLSLLS